MKTPFEISVTDDTSACAYLIALALSDWQYHIDDDPHDVVWEFPITASQIDHLALNTALAVGALGNETAWAVYYGAHVVAGKMNP